MMIGEASGLFIWIDASIWSDWFGWPDGAVLTNLIASLIWGAVAWRKLHAIHKAHKHLHARLDTIEGISSPDKMEGESRDA